MSALYANRNLGITHADVAKSIEKLSSGQRINRAGDDASGLAVSEKMRSQIRGLNQAEKNIQNGVSFIQTTEGYLQETQDIMHRLRELSVQSANGIYTDEDRMQIQVEVSQLVDEVNRIASHAQFNGMNLLTGAFAQNSAVNRVMQLQVGANMDQNKQIFIGTIDAALKVINKQRADLGAYQNRFEMAAEGVAIAAENLQAAESRIRDADMASEMVQYAKDAILSQSGTAMLAQANVQTQSVLQLLG
jgi:flagellin